jgi:hypothetical protein
MMWSKGTCMFHRMRGRTGRWQTVYRRDTQTWSSSTHSTIVMRSFSRGVRRITGRRIEARRGDRLRRLPHQHTYQIPFRSIQTPQNTAIFCIRAWCVIEMVWDLSAVTRYVILHLWWLTRLIAATDILHQRSFRGYFNKTALGHNSVPIRA